MAVELDEAAAFLAQHFDGAATGAALAGTGEWSRAYAFDLGGQAFIIRFGNHIDDFLKDRRAAACARPGLPIPAITEVGQAFGGYFAISTRAHGRLLDTLGPDDFRTTLPAVFRAVDAMRTVDLGDITGFGVWTAGGNAPFASWAEFLLSVRDHDPTDRTYGRTAVEPFPEVLAVYDRAFSELEQLVGRCPNGRHLVHNDLLHLNVLVGDNHELTGIIDWGASLYGDSVYDIAVISLWTPWHPVFGGIDVRALARDHFAALPGFDVRLTCYELHVALGGLAYQAHAGHDDEMAWTARRLDEVLSRA